MFFLKFKKGEINLYKQSLLPSVKKVTFTVWRLLVPTAFRKGTFYFQMISPSC